MSAADLFNEEMLSKADAKDVPHPPQEDSEPTRVESTSVGTTAYKRFLVPAFWHVYSFNSSRHERTASWVFGGQILYGLFLVAILCTGLVVAAGAGK